MDLYFSDYFHVSPKKIERYGAFNISLRADLPLFIDPFLLFNSRKHIYKKLHRDIIKYLLFLRDKSGDVSLDKDLVKAWYRFPEVSQTWLGFSEGGNAGRGLGRDFAIALHDNLHRIFHGFGKEKITKGSHLEKLCLIKDGVGRDNISDFTTNLIHGFLLDYTQAFARKYIDKKLRRVVAAEKVRFNYTTEVWERRKYDLPWHNDDYVLLVPSNILTKDDTWINKNDLIDEFAYIPSAIPDGPLRMQVSNYFQSVLGKARRPTQKDRAHAAFQTLRQFPELVDYYIRMKEQHGDRAVSISSSKVDWSKRLYVEQFRMLPDLLARTTEFYRLSGRTYAEAHKRLAFLKDVIENKGGHRIFYVDGAPIEREGDLHILYRLTWAETESDVTREANDGRGPVDFKVSRGSRDKTLVEFKLASNSQLERNLQKQTAVYQKASDAKRCIKVIIFFSQAERDRVERILKRLKLLKSEDVVLIDARNDNKPSGSKA